VRLLLAGEPLLVMTPRRHPRSVRCGGSVEAAPEGAGMASAISPRIIGQQHTACRRQGTTADRCKTGGREGGRREAKRN
jgi:hypothetical protein